SISMQDPLSTACGDAMTSTSYCNRARTSATETPPILSFRCRPVQDLLVLKQPRAQFLVVHLLDGDVVRYGEHGCRGGRLAQDHEHRLHPDGTVADVRRRQAHWHEKIGAFGYPRHERAIGDRIRRETSHPDVALD